MEGNAKPFNQKSRSKALRLFSFTALIKRLTALRLYGSTAGQTLVELLLALGIFAFIMTAVFALVFGGLTTGLRTEEQDYATMYAQEGLDAARSIRDTDWTAFAQNGTHGVVNSGSGWSWGGINNEITYGARKFTREIFVEDVYRTASGNIFTGSDSVNFDYTNNADYQCEGGVCPSANIDNIAGTAQLKEKISMNPRELTSDATNTKALYHFNKSEGDELDIGVPGNLTDDDLGGASETNLKGLWHLNENTGTTAADTSGSNNNGMVFEAPNSLNTPSSTGTYVLGSTSSNQSYPVFILRLSNGKYRLYYSWYNGVYWQLQYKDTSDTNPPSGTNLGAAMTLNTGTAATAAAYAPYVMQLSNGKYRLYFSWSNGTYFQLQYKDTSTSDNSPPNSTNITTGPGTSLNTGSAAADQAYMGRSIIQLSNGKYRLYYGQYDITYYKLQYKDTSDTNPPDNLNIAAGAGTSLNTGTSTTDHALHPGIIRLPNNKYRLYFARSDNVYWRIQYKDTTDTNPPDNLNITSGAGTWLNSGAASNNQAYAPFIYQLPNGKYYLYYNWYQDANNYWKVYYKEIGPTWTTAGKFSNALQFDGANDYVSVPNGFTNTIKADDTNTIELWVYPLSVANQPVLYDAYQLAGGYDSFLEIGNAAANIMYWGVGGGSANYRVYQGTVLPINQWHHIVAVKTGSGNSGDLYIDGILQTTYTNVGTGLGNTPNVNSDLYFGRYRSGSFYLNGSIDEAAIYDAPLTAAQIKEHYERGLAKDAAISLPGTAWSYREPITITGSTAGAQIDYQVLVTVDTAALISAVPSKMQSNGADIRFANSSGTELPYWIESGMNSIATKIWVTVPSIPISPGTVTIYMYYGNPNTSGKSVGDATLGLASSSPGTSCLHIKTNNNAATSGTYWIKPASTAFQSYCDMSTDGKVWTKIDSNLAAISVNKGTAVWSGTNIAGTGLGTACSTNTVQYTLTPSNITYSEGYALLTRTTSVLQCSGINASDGSVSQSANGYYTPAYTGSFTSNGMCLWSDAKWANATNTNMTNLKLNWVMKFNSTNPIAPLRYNTHCSSSTDNGSFTMQWFVRRAGNLANDPAVGAPGIEETSFISPNNFSDSNEVGTIIGSITTAGNINLHESLSFDGVDDYVSVGNVGAGIKSVEFWINNTDSDASDGILELIDNVSYVSIASGAITATGFDCPINCTIYVDGSSASATLSSGWHHIAITTNTAINAASVKIGEANNNYFSGYLDEVAIWDKTLSQQDIWDHIGANVGYQTNSYAIVKRSANFPVTDYIDRFKELVETATIPAGTSIDYQLSTDNCATMKYWDGDSWENAGGWNDARTITRYINFLTPSSTICLSARLNTTDTNQTPVLDKVEIKYTTNKDIGITGPADTHTKKVTSRVKWPSGFSFQDISLAEYLTDWMYPEFIDDADADFTAMGSSCAGGMCGMEAGVLNGAVYAPDLGATPAYYSSAPKDAGAPSNFLKVKWSASVPPGAILKFLLNSADTEAGLVSGNWCGPTQCLSYPDYNIGYVLTDGNGEIVLNPANNNHQWFQYYIIIDEGTSDPATSPSLDKITIQVKNLY